MRCNQNPMPCGVQAVSQEALRARQAAVITVALERLLEHVRRGQCTPLFEAALDELDRRLARCRTATEGGAGRPDAEGWCIAWDLWLGMDGVWFYGNWR